MGSIKRIKMKHKTIIPYEHHLVEKARYLRNNSTFAERVLWKHLKRKQLLQYDFDRQKPIMKYIVDFFCNELMLAIEIDGISHLHKKKYDAKRQNDLEKLGITVLRFDGYEVINNTTNVLSAILHWIETQNKPTPTPSREGH